MDNDENRIDWARIFAEPVTERTSRMAIKCRMDIGFYLILGCAFIPLITVAIVFGPDCRKKAEIKETETMAPHSSSGGMENVKRSSGERYASSEKEPERSTKLCVINGKRYLVYRDGSILEEWSPNKWHWLNDPPAWLVERIKSAHNKGF